jgi:hypothetical protein
VIRRDRSSRLSPYCRRFVYALLFGMWLLRCGNPCGLLPDRPRSGAEDKVSLFPTAGPATSPSDKNSPVHSRADTTALLVYPLRLFSSLAVPLSQMPVLLFSRSSGARSIPHRRRTRQVHLVWR